MTRNIWRRFKTEVNTNFPPFSEKLRCIKHEQTAYRKKTKCHGFAWRVRGWRDVFRDRFAWMQPCLALRRKVSGNLSSHPDPSGAEPRLEEDHPRSGSSSRASGFPPGCSPDWPPASSAGPKGFPTGSSCCPRNSPPTGDPARGSSGPR